jgi:hypothetical protein
MEAFFPRKVISVEFGFYFAAGVVLFFFVACVAVSCLGVLVYIGKCLYSVSFGWMHTDPEVYKLGRELGYPEDEIMESVAYDPVATLHFLQRRKNSLRTPSQ